MEPPPLLAVIVAVAVIGLAAGHTRRQRTTLPKLFGHAISIGNSMILA